MSTQQQIGELLFWASYYYDFFAPLLNIIIKFSIDTIIIRKIYDIAKIKYESLINVSENIPTE